MSHFQNLYKKIVSFSVVVIKSYVTKGWGMNRVSFQSLLILFPHPFSKHPLSVSTGGWTLSHRTSDVTYLALCTAPEK